MAKINETIETNEVKENNQLQSILDRLETLEKENKELKDSKENMIKKWKERVSWQIKASYKMWGWVPVLSYITYKKDTTKPLLYKNSNGEYISNHYLELSCADWKKYKVEVNEFWAWFTRSEKQEVYDERGQAIMLEKWKLVWGEPSLYMFKTKDYWDIFILPNLIN